MDVLTRLGVYFFATCLVVVRLVTGFFAVAFDFDRDDFDADDLAVVFECALALLDFALLDFALDLLPMRPALTDVCVRVCRERATRSGRFQPMARSARNFAGISSIPSP